MFVFGSGTIVAKPFGPNAAGGASPLQFGTMQEISVDIQSSQKELYGKQQYPVAIARTAGKINCKAKFATIYAKVLNDLYFGDTVTAGQTIGVIDELHTGSSASAGVPGGATFAEDLGAIDGVTGAQLTLTTGAPGPGEYSVSGGTYAFNSAQATATKISYTYKIAGGQTVQVTNRPMGAMPTFSVNLVNNQYGNNLKLRFPFCISSKLTLAGKNEDFTVPELDFSAFQDPSGVVFEWDTDF